MAKPSPDHVFEAGDIVWVVLDPAVGHEQRGRRPAIVVSPASYNRRSSYLLVCPITRNANPWPYKIPLPEGSVVEGMVLTDQVRSIDRTQRVVRHEGRVPAETLQLVRNMIVTLLGEDEQF